MDDSLVQRMEVYVAQLEKDASQLRDQRGIARMILWVGLPLALLGLVYHWAAALAGVLLTVTTYFVWIYIGFTHQEETRERLVEAQQRLSKMRSGATG